MNKNFLFDVFVSYSSQDKTVVRDVANRLRQDGLKVWFDEWVIKPGDSIPAMIEEGLEHSRVLLLCMSANAFGSEWAGLEAGTFRFRDPLNKERRFIPLRLDDAPIKGSLAQFLHINWHAPNREGEYAKLLAACWQPTTSVIAQAEFAPAHFAKNIVQLESEDRIRIWAYEFASDERRTLSGGRDNTVRLWDISSRHCVCKLEGHLSEVWTVAWSTDHRLVVSGSWDETVRVWDLKKEQDHCVSILVGHTDDIWSVALSKDQGRVLSASADKTIRLWDVTTAKCLYVFSGHTSGVRFVAWSPDETQMLSGSWDRTVRVWDVRTGQCQHVLEGHNHDVLCVQWSPDGRRALSCSKDRTLRMWDSRDWRCLGTYLGHQDNVDGAVWSSDNRHALSWGGDENILLWDLDSGLLLRILKGHTSPVKSVSWSADGRHAFSGDQSGEIRVWDLTEFVTEAIASTVTVPALPLAQDQVQYTNAKVLLVGDSGVGKTGLCNYLAHGIKVEDNKPLPSTDGTWATHWPLPHDEKKAGVEREIWLWDFAGQVDYRLVHQLFMDETAAAILVFNPQNENPFNGLGHWDCDLQKAARKPFAKLLTGARIDRGGLVVSSDSIKRFMKERGFLTPLHLTSAMTGQGCGELCDAIVKAVDWDGIPTTTSPTLYRRMKQEIISLRDSGLVLMRLAELKQQMELTLRGESFDLAELDTVIRLLAGAGMIQRLDFGGFVLLRPEVLSRYAAAVVRKVRKHPQELGCIRENELLAGDLDYHDFQRLRRDDEVVVLRTLLETFVSRAWCLRQLCDDTAILTFPSYFRRERKGQPSHPSVLVTYRFDGPADEIYATLVVRLHHTVAFQTADLWRSAADFKTQTGAALGFTLTPETEGSSRLEVYFASDVDENSRVVFLRYVHEHLTQHGQNVVRLRHYSCRNRKCDSHGEQFTHQSKIDRALAPGGKGKVFCPDCGKPILLRDVIEEKFESPTVTEKVRELQIEVQVVLDNESRELILVGHAYSIVAEAGQIYRGYTNSDHGIDGEIEFKDDQGRASGKRLYMQLKSGDSYLKKRRRDDSEVFQIKEPRWADYWQKQAYAVMLVIRFSDGEIRWMNVTEYLRREGDSGKKPVTQIVFEGERFDVMSVRRWRDRVLRGLFG